MAKRLLYTKRLGAIVAKDAKGSADGKFHVILSLSNKWVVVVDGKVKPVKAFTTQKEAVSFAEQSAILKSFKEVVVHGEDGTISNIISYRMVS